MPMDRLEENLTAQLRAMEASGRAKGAETLFAGILPSADGKGPRYLLAGEGERPYLRMNSNSYLGLSLNAEVQDAEEEAVQALGAGPGAVRFISGSWAPHAALEQRLARYHGREAAMIFSSAYATTMGVLPQLIDSETAVISDALNHSCIINAMRLARPKQKRVYDHLDLAALDRHLGECADSCRRAVMVTDGIFSMRGDHAPLDKIMALAAKHDASYAENVIVAADDSHGVGAFGATGRGTEEFCTSPPVDVLIATLGKSFGINGGYVTGSAALISYLRETSPFYIYSNPITPGEAAAALKAVEIVERPEGQALLAHLRAMTARFEAGLLALGYETIAGSHPVVPLMVRNTTRTSALVAFLRANGVLATGLNFPVVPEGDEEIHFQISADHTENDIDEALAVLDAFVQQE